MTEMSEKIDQKTSFIKYEGRGFFTDRGLYQDAKNIWCSLQGILASLQVAERGNKKERTAELLSRLNLPRQTYEDYIRQRYSESDAQEILESSNSVSVGENDSLVAEYNLFISSGQMTPEMARQFMQKGVEIFSGPTTGVLQEKSEGNPKE
jgi:hypothetical protein